MCKLEPKWNTWIDNYVYKFSLPLSWTSLGNFPLLAIWLPSTTAYGEVMHRKSIKANLKTTVWGIFPIPLFLIIPHILENYIMYLYKNFLLGIDQLSFPYRSLGDCWLWDSQVFVAQLHSSKDVPTWLQLVGLFLRHRSGDVSWLIEVQRF